MEVSVRELNEKLTGYLERAHNGEHVVITRHGKAYVEIGPPHEMSRDAKSDLSGRLRAIPGVTWSGRTLSGISKPVPLSGRGPSIAKIIIEGRR